MVSRPFFYIRLLRICAVENGVCIGFSLLLVAGFFLHFCHFFIPLPKPKCAVNTEHSTSDCNAAHLHFLHCTPYTIWYTHQQTQNLHHLAMAHHSHYETFGEVKRIRLTTKTMMASRVPTKQSTNDPANFSSITKRFVSNTRTRNQETGTVKKTVEWEKRILFQSCDKIRKIKQSLNGSWFALN